MNALRTTLAAMMVSTTWCSQTQSQTSVPAGPGALEESVLSLAEARLAAVGLFFDRDKAWVGVPTPLTSAQGFEVRPLWPADSVRPVLPLQFEARAASVGASPMIVTLVVTLQRDVLVAARTLRKGSASSCSDLVVERRDLRNLPRSTMTPPCSVAAGAVVRRSFNAHDVVRQEDIGLAPAIAAGAPVRLSVAAGTIQVSTIATALSDAWIGDETALRLQHPSRILRARVTAPGVASLTEGAP